MQAFCWLPLFWGDCCKDLECKDKDSDCTSYRNEAVNEVDGPSTGLVNQELNYTVSFSCYNGCGDFGKFEEAVGANNTRTISVVAKYQGCMCTQDVPSRRATYKFKAIQAGTYYLKFQQNGTNYLTKTVTIAQQ
ncbi:hypothetical protein SAMN05421780_10272 [Flexibacter flexilis DSM 6793]|uniref:Por secretion system C-terminal sorting domain-containing protein n=1 Tax=Flexibacter flexilis DSM 6793 TaxID=927664 RepID=A0A1I1FCX7_9BACT|nr:hypothetical protein [Flexibacter flexilis]SFB95003.1 hypothetical protein SAMN05421780_10272 [Flexibacter flexilis DSM 6793]